MTRKISICINIVCAIISFLCILYPSLWSMDISESGKLIDIIGNPDGPTAIFLTARLSKPFLAIYWVFTLVFVFNAYFLSSKRFTNESR